MELNLMHSLAGLMVGTIVGITGVGGGALMTPLLVLLFGVAPHTAVGTDLLYASLTKTVGVGVHHNHGTVDWGVVKRLAMGSLPAAAATLAYMHFSGMTRVKSGFLIDAVGVALIITALGMLFKDQLHAFGARFRSADTSKWHKLQPIATILCGIVLGILVTLTSIGAGALGTVMLVYLYPLRLNASKLVGTDLAHAIPLAMIAGLGHLMLGNVDWQLLVQLLMGSIPGVFLGSLISTRAPMTFIRYAIALTLGAVAIKMLTM